MTFRYAVLFDTQEYLRRPGVHPRQSIVIPEEDNQAWRVVNDHLMRSWRVLARPAVGGLRHPFFVPGAIYKGLWDWDAFFIACAVPDDGLAYGRGSIANLLDGVRADGRPPKAASPAGAYDYDSHPYPLQAQFVHMVSRRLGDVTWVEPYWAALQALHRWYEREAVSRERYFVWTSFHGNGIDNNPAVYGRPARSSGGVDLACWHYREYRAMARLAAALGHDAGEYCDKAEALGTLIRSRYWDHIDGLFYNVDCLADVSQTSRQGIGWECFLKFRNWTTFFPLWAGVATAGQAEALRAKALDPSEFLSPAGLRSHSARDPIYNNAPTGNPSNWQGPVWGLSTFLTAYGLARYGFVDEALDLAMRQIRVFAADIRTNGCLHEFYHGDTGQPLLNPGFLSWDLLALRVVDDLREGRDCTTLDLLDA